MEANKCVYQHQNLGNAAVNSEKDPKMYSRYTLCCSGIRDRFTETKKIVCLWHELPENITQRSIKFFLIFRYYCENNYIKMCGMGRTRNVYSVMWNVCKVLGEKFSKEKFKWKPLRFVSRPNVSGCDVH